MRAGASLNVAIENNGLECLVVNFQEEVHLLSKALVWKVSVNKNRRTLKVLNVSSSAHVCACLLSVFDFLFPCLSGHYISFNTQLELGMTVSEAKESAFPVFLPSQKSQVIASCRLLCLGNTLM